MKTSRHKPVRPRMVPANGAPASFAEAIEHEALAFRAQRTALGAFLATELEKIAGKARFLRAENPGQYYEREEVEEDNLRTHWYDLGRQHESEDQSEQRTWGPLGRPLTDHERIRYATPGGIDPETFSPDR